MDSECFPHVQDRGRRKKSLVIFYKGIRVEKFGHAFMKFQKRNRSLRVELSSKEKAYTLDVHLPIKSSDAVEIRKSKEEKCQKISENKINTNENPENYLKLKDGKKIRVVNRAFWKTI